MDIKVSENVVLEGVSQACKNLIKRRMAFENPEWQKAVQFGRSTYGIRKTIRLYEDVGESLVIPRGSLYRLLIMDDIDKINKLEINTTSFPVNPLPHNIELRELQKPWVTNMLMHKQGIGVAPAGSGKTVMALYLLAQLGVPTLWITHRLTLIDQVLERIKTFLPSIGNVGVFGGGKKKFGDLLTIGSVLTLARNELDEFKNRFGMVIVDECHIVPAFTAMSVIRKLNPEYLYGLTATPYREDKLERIMYDTIGPEIAKMDRDDAIALNGILPARVQVIHTGVTYPKDRDYVFNDIIDYLLAHPERNKIILLKVLSELAEGNTAIVLTCRVEHGAIIKAVLAELNIESEHIHALTPHKKRIEAMKRFASGEIKLLIATYQLLSEGFDHAPTNRVFFALPQKAKRQLEQSKGRIERFLADKDDAIVYDFVDDIPMMQNQFEIRKEHYLDQNLRIDYE